MEVWDGGARANRFELSRFAKGAAMGVEWLCNWRGRIGKCHTRLRTFQESAPITLDGIELIQSIRKILFNLATRWFEKSVASEVWNAVLPIQ